MNQDRQHITPLPKRVQPYQWEDLGSFLVRTAKEMGYEKPHWLLKPEMSSHGIKQSELPILSRQADYDLLSQLLLVPETRLYQMTLHRFSSLFNTSAATENPLLHLQKMATHSPWSPIDRPLLPRNYGWSVLSKAQVIRICPFCTTTTGAYDRLYWRLEPLLTCPLHHILLQFFCPICLKQWPALRSSGACCPSCHQPIHQNEKACRTQNHPAFSSLLQGDLLTLHMAGYEVDLNHRNCSSLEQDLRVSVPPVHYLSFLRIICTFQSYKFSRCCSAPACQKLLSCLSNKCDSHINFPGRSEAFAGSCCPMANIQTHRFSHIKFRVSG